MAYDYLRGVIAKDPHDIGVKERFIAGGLAGGVSQIVVYPLEIVRTRLAIAPSNTYTGAWHCLTSMMRAEGVRSLFKGLTVSVIGIVPYAGVDLSVNSFIREQLSIMYQESKASDVGV